MHDDNNYDDFDDNDHHNHDDYNDDDHHHYYDDFDDSYTAKLLRLVRLHMDWNGMDVQPKQYL